MRTSTTPKVSGRAGADLGTGRGGGEPSMECDGPCGCRLIVVMSQDSVGVSEF